MWKGQYSFALRNLILKDFRVRYRNMSLGVLWSLLNPLVMMVVLTFVFTRIFHNPDPNFPVFVLCGLVPLSFFQIAWATGTSAVVENAGLIKRVQMPREVIPVASVLSNCLHLVIQIVLLLSLAVAFGLGVNWNWLWIPVTLGLEIVFVCGLVMASTAINVYVRDTRYVVESINTVLIWMVPVFYKFDDVPQRFKSFYELNPVAALVLSLRHILLEGRPPREILLLKLAVAAAASLLLGWYLFSRLKRGFYTRL